MIYNLWRTVGPRVFIKGYSSVAGSLANSYLGNYMPRSGACTGYTKFDARGYVNGSAETSPSRDDNAVPLRLAPDHISRKDLS